MTKSFFQAFVLLVLVTDPFGNVPIFVSALTNVPPERRWRVVVRECAIAFALLLLFMFFGRNFLEFVARPRDEHEVGASAREQLGELESETARRAGDDCSHTAYLMNRAW